MIAPRAGLRRRRLGRFDKAKPLRAGQDGVGVGVLLKLAAAILEGRHAAAQPVEDAAILQRPQPAPYAASADAGFLGERLIARIELPGAEVEKAENHRMQHGKAVTGNGSVLLAFL